MMVIDKKLKPFYSILETYSEDKVYLMNLLANWAIKVRRGKNGLWEFHECAGGGCYTVHELSHSGITPLAVVKLLLWYRPDIRCEIENKALKILKRETNNDQ